MASEISAMTHHYLAHRLDGAGDLYLLALALGERGNPGMFGAMIREARIHFAARGPGSAEVRRPPESIRGSFVFAGASSFTKTPWTSEPVIIGCHLMRRPPGGRPG